MKIRTEFSFFVCGLIVVGVLSTTVGAFIIVKEWYQKEINKKIISDAEKFSYVCKESSVIEDEILILNFTKVLKKITEGLDYAAFVDNTGRIISTDQSQFQDFILSRHNFQKKTIKNLKFHKEEIKFKNQAYIEISAPVFSRDKILGICYLGFEKDTLYKSINENVRQMRNRIIMIATVALIAGLLITVVITNRLTAPIEKLSYLTTLLGSGKFDTKIEIKTKNEIGKLAEEFDRMRIKLKELDELKKGFISSVSHELRTSLTVIEGYVDWLLSAGMTKKHEDVLNTMKTNITKLGNFIADILELAKIEAGKMTLEKKYVNIYSFLEEIVDFFQIVAIDKGIDLSIDIQKGIPLCFWDETKIRVVFANLFSNALKFTPAAGKINISVGLDNNLNRVKFSVADSGIGIPDEEIPNIFEKFHQARVTSNTGVKREGLGLGLTIAKSIVELSDGKIWVESQEGKGTTFHVVLPIA